MDVVLTALMGIMKGTKLSSELMRLYYDAYNSFNEGLKAFANNEELIPSLISLFDQQWTFVNQYKKIRSKNQMKVMTSARTLFEISEDLKITVPELLIFPNTIKDRMKSYISTFYLLKDTFELLTGNTSDNKSPFKDITKTCKPINCRELIDNEYKNRFLEKNDEMFILSEPNYENIKEPKIVFKISMASIRVSRDFDDLKKLTIYIQNHKEKALFFSNHMMVSYVKNWIEEAASNNIKEQLQAVQEYLNSCKVVN